MITQFENNLSKLGCSASFTEESITQLYNVGFRKFQVMLSDSIDFTISQNYNEAERIRRVKKNLPNDIDIVVHAPIWFNFCKDDRLTKLTIKELYAQLTMCSMIGAGYLVTHVGAYQSQKELEKGIVRSREQCFDNWLKLTKYLIPGLENSNICLCFENTAGNKNNSYMGTVTEILQLKHLLPTHFVGFCLDTVHAFANGESCFQGPTLFDSLVDMVDIFHLNPAPKKVKYGSHLDRHSTSTFAGDSDLNTDFLLRILHRSNVPMILEKSSNDLLVEDMAWLKGKLNG